MPNRRRFRRGFFRYMKYISWIHITDPAYMNNRSVKHHSCVLFPVYFFLYGRWCMVIHESNFLFEVPRNTTWLPRVSTYVSYASTNTCTTNVVPPISAKCFHQGELQVSTWIYLGISTCINTGRHLLCCRCFHVQKDKCKRQVKLSVSTRYNVSGWVYYWHIKEIRVVGGHPPNRPPLIGMRSTKCLGTGNLDQMLKKG